MLAVFLALKNFLADLRGYHVLVHSDHTSVVSYINHQGGLWSRPLCKLVCQILLWSQDKLLSLRAAYILGAHNIGADILSRQGLRPREWRRHSEVVELIWREFSQAQVDLFASRETSHCPLWFSLTHPAPLGLDAMVQTWPRLHLYAFSRSLCSREFWREFAGTGFYYFSLPRGGRAEYGSQIYIHSRRASFEAPRQEGPSVPSRQRNILPPTRTVETVSLASEGPSS